MTKLNGNYEIRIKNQELLRIFEIFSFYSEFVKVKVLFFFCRRFLFILLRLFSSGLQSQEIKTSKI